MSVFYPSVEKPLPIRDKAIRLCSLVIDDISLHRVEAVRSSVSQSGGYADSVGKRSDLVWIMG